MQIIQEYLKAPKSWKAVPFNFRGNVANKTFVEAFKEANNFANSGQALDYIVQSFAEANEHTSRLTHRNTFLESRVAELEAKLFEAESKGDSSLLAATSGSDSIDPRNKTSRIPAGMKVSDLKPEHIDALKTELQESLKDEEEKAMIFLLVQTLIGLDERLLFLKAHTSPDDKNPFDCIVHYQKNVEVAILKMMHDPLQLLTGADYKALKEWDENIFMPAMRALTGIPDLKLTGAQKFNLIWDYAKADPIGQLPDIGVPEELKSKLIDMQFPRAEMVQKILEEIKANAAAQPVQEEK